MLSVQRDHRRLLDVGAVVAVDVALGPARLERELLARQRVRGDRAGTVEAGVLQRHGPLHDVDQLDAAGGGAGHLGADLDAGDEELVADEVEGVAREAVGKEGGARALVLVGGTFDSVAMDRTLARSPKSPPIDYGITRSKEVPAKRHKAPP